MRQRTRYPQTVAVAFAAAAFAVVALLWVSGTATGQSRGEQDREGRQAVDLSPEETPYVSGELLVAFESGKSRVAEAAIQRAGGDIEDRLRDIDTLQIEFPSVADERAGEARERALERIRRALESNPAVASAEYNYIREFSYVPNDRFFGQQYGLRKPNYPRAWNTSRGGNVRIGIVDSGVQAGHPDLRGKVVAQRDFVFGDNRADDDVGHGTHVAGIAAAKTGNRRGVAGGCPGCDILAAKVGDNIFGPTDARIARGINWSVNRGAKVVNLSLGGPRGSDVLRRAVNRAWNQGAVVVAAAGNDGTFQKSYPAAYPRAMAVGATNRYDRRAGFSQRGGWLSVAAPGVGIISTVPGGYDRFSGTSMSSPNVAGLSGLLARQGRSNQQIRNRIQNTAVDLGPNGKDVNYGYGRINAARAVKR